eukprot:GHVT01063928.1.p1 GENE.GHVT01063928.1~~GHVT01063928.1.p1  ORF type:complete len:176 (+),score=33.45 GHVT01063928.1:266-793(+)
MAASKPPRLGQVPLAWFVGALILGVLVFSTPLAGALPESAASSPATSASDATEPANADALAPQAAMQPDGAAGDNLDDLPTLDKPTSNPTADVSVSAWSIESLELMEKVALISTCCVGGLIIAASIVGVALDFRSRKLRQKQDVRWVENRFARKRQKQWELTEHTRTPPQFSQHL